DAPGYNLGNAADWATNAAAHGVRVDGTAAVGAIAQWNANTAWATSSFGHVGYVQAVSANSITVVADNYPFWSGSTYYTGHMDTETFQAGSSYWPSNFIHFKDQPGPDSPSTTFGALNSAN